MFYAFTDLAFIDVKSLMPEHLMKDGSGSPAATDTNTILHPENLMHNTVFVQNIYQSI